MRTSQYGLTSFTDAVAQIRSVNLPCSQADRTRQLRRSFTDIVAARRMCVRLLLQLPRTI